MTFVIDNLILKLVTFLERRDFELYTTFYED